MNFGKIKKNIGPDKNFVKLIEKSKGRFCWIFGDDEYLERDSLNKVLDIIQKNSKARNIYISNKKINNIEKIKCPNNYLKNQNYWISFITANIFNKEYLTSNINRADFIGSYLIQETYYIESILKAPYNIVINQKIFSTDRDDTQESFKLFQVFGENQNMIFKYFIKMNFQKSTIDFINKEILKKFFPANILYMKKLKENYKWEKEDVYSEMKKTFSNYFEFYMYCVPVIKLPYFIGKVYYFIIRKLFLRGEIDE